MAQSLRFAGMILSKASFVYIPLQQVALWPSFSHHVHWQHSYQAITIQSHNTTHRIYVACSTRKEDRNATRWLSLLALGLSHSIARSPSHYVHVYKWTKLTENDVHSDCSWSNDYLPILQYRTTILSLVGRRSTHHCESRAAPPIKPRETHPLQWKVWYGRGTAQGEVFT